MRAYNRMEIEELIAISSEIGNAIRSCISGSPDYGEIVETRERDVTRRIDMVAERALEESLRRRDKCARIISEELGDHVYPAGGEPQFTLIFDPVDGSTNATLDIPLFCTSIAYSPLVKRVTFNDIQASVVETIQGRRYYAVRGGNAFVDGTRLPRAVKGKTKRVLSIYTYGADRIPSGLLQFEREAKHIVVRVLGSIAMEICLVAEGAIDGLIDVRGMVRGYDIAAASLILEEAGGIITDLQGEELGREVLGKLGGGGISCIAVLDRRKYYGRILKLVQDNG